MDNVDETETLRRLLTNSGFEVIPLAGAIDKLTDLPAGATVSVTVSPAKGMPATVEMSEHLAAAGFRTIPHLSARATRDRAELEGIVRRLAAAGIDTLFVVGGDTPDPGEFFDAGAVIRAMNDIGHTFRLGIAGYPEGHPFIGDNELMDALVEKAPEAGFITTQMCFDVAGIGSWIERVRRCGVTLPVYVGIPGVIDLAKLVGIAARIGVGPSVRYLTKNRRALTRLIVAGRYLPDQLTAEVAELDETGTGGIAGFHVFTFNQIAATAEWHTRALLEAMR